MSCKQNYKNIMNLSRMTNAEILDLAYLNGRRNRGGDGAFTRLLRFLKKAVLDRIGVAASTQ